MKFEATKLAGALVVKPGRFEDERGHFARTWCRREFEEQGLDSTMAQCSFSYNAVKGTLRGMHYQAPPHEETKLVRCTRGAIFDVLVDLRPGSETYHGWVGYQLTEENGHALYVPPGVAHGFISLVDATEVFYQISAFYQPDAMRGVRWDDEVFGIEWPEPVRAISQRDRDWPAIDSGRAAAQ